MKMAVPRRASRIKIPHERVVITVISWEKSAKAAITPRQRLMKFDWIMLTAKLVSKRN